MSHHHWHGWQRGRTDRRVSEPQVARRHFSSETFSLASIVPALSPCALGRVEERPKNRITNPSLHVSPLCCAPREDSRRPQRGIQNVVRPAMVHYSRIWQQIPAMQALMHSHYGSVWLAMVYILWS